MPTMCKRGRGPTSKSSIQAEMPRAASLLQGSFSTLSKVPNGSAAESGTETPSVTCDIYRVHIGMAFSSGLTWTKLVTSQ